MKKKPTKKRLWIAGWWQGVRGKIHSARQWTGEHVREWQHKQELYGEEDGDAINGNGGKERRITFFTVVRIIMAELGEKEYWQTLWQLLWRPGYVMSDFVNGKGRRYLKPFQLLMGTTILLAIALAIVPAKVDKGESLEVRFERRLSKADITEEAREEAKPVWTCVKYMEKYRLWKEEHMTFKLLTTFILPVFFTWLLFRKSPRRMNDFVQAKSKQANYNFPEILTIEIFVAAQLQFVNTIWILIVGWTRPTLTLEPFVFPEFVSYIILFIDYQQLFGRKWYDTLWRTILCGT